MVYIYKFKRERARHENIQNFFPPLPDERDVMQFDPVTPATAGRRARSKRSRIPEVMVGDTQDSTPTEKKLTKKWTTEWMSSSSGKQQLVELEEPTGQDDIKTDTGSDIITDTGSDTQAARTFRGKKKVEDQIRENETIMGKRTQLEVKWEPSAGEQGSEGTRAPQEDTEMDLTEEKVTMGEEMNVHNISPYKGVTFYKRTGKWECNLW